MAEFYTRFAGQSKAEGSVGQGAASDQGQSQPFDTRRSPHYWFSRLVELE